MGRIGFVNICHPDYLGEVVTLQAERAFTALRESGIDVVRVEAPIVHCKTAEAAGRFLLKQEVDGVVVFLGTWIECPVAMALIREVEHLPICLWGFPMYMKDGKLRSTGSYVSFAMFRGTLERVQYPFKAVLGFPDEPETVASVHSFCTAAITAIRLKRTRIGLVGYASMGMYTGTFDHVLLRVRIGPEVEHVDAYTLVNMIARAPDAAADAVAQEYRDLADFDAGILTDDIRTVSKFHLALRQLAEQKDLDAINIKCQYEFSQEFGMAACVPLSLLADKGIVASCEGDMLNTVSMIMLHYLTDSVVTYGDAIHHHGNVLKLSSCGFLPFSMGQRENRSIKRFAFEGFSGLHTSHVMRPEKVTVMRLIEDIGSYHILYMTGQGLDTDLREGVLPAIDVRLDGDIDKLVANYSGQHFAICYGDVSNEIECLAGILGIRTIRV